MKTKPALTSAIIVAVVFLLLRFVFGLYVSIFASSSMVGKIYGAIGHSRFFVYGFI